MPSGYNSHLFKAKNSIFPTPKYKKKNPIKNNKILKKIFKELAMKHG
jgi:hypothetical protein